jgi:hypothetical protein
MAQARKYFMTSTSIWKANRFSFSLGPQALERQRF